MVLWMNGRYRGAITLSHPSSRAGCPACSHGVPLLRAIPRTGLRPVQPSAPVRTLSLSMSVVNRLNLFNRQYIISQTTAPMQGESLQAPDEGQHDAPTYPDLISPRPPSRYDRSLYCAWGSYPDHRAGRMPRHWGQPLRRCHLLKDAALLPAAHFPHRHARSGRRPGCRVPRHSTYLR